MITRISTASMQNSILANLRANQNKLYETQIQALTGNKINSIADNPVDAAKILGFNDSLGKLESYQKNVSVAQSEFETLDGTLKLVQDKLQRLNELANSAANEYNTPETLQAIKNEVSAIKTSLIGFANTQYDGRYIFAGTNTAQPAFSTSDNGSITYDGTPSTGDYKRRLEVSEGTYLTLNAPGDTVFGSYDADTDTGNGIFGTISEFEKALDNAMSDDEAVSKAGFSAIRSNIINENLANLDNVTNIRTQFGTEAQKADLSETSLTDNVTLLKSDRSKIQDIDTAEVYSNLLYQQYALQASMQVSAMSLQPTLLDFI